jgi:hypothetical protein
MSGQFAQQTRNTELNLQSRSRRCDKVRVISIESLIDVYEHMRFNLLHRSHAGCSLSHRTLRSLHMSHVVLLDLDAGLDVPALDKLREAMKYIKYFSLKT